MRWHHETSEVEHDNGRVPERAPCRARLASRREGDGAHRNLERRKLGPDRIGGENRLFAGGVVDGENKTIGRESQLLAAGLIDGGTDGRKGTPT